MSVDSLSASTLRVSDHFPKVLSPCEAVAASFFHCFTENSRQLSGAVRQKKRWNPNEFLKIVYIFMF
jgi:hypothetical protein